MTAYCLPDDLQLGIGAQTRIPLEDQKRQRREAEEILQRLEGQPGVILADEVGMGKTFVALATAVAVARQARSGPVIVMVPPNLVDKWSQDLRTFFQLYMDGASAVQKPLTGPWPPHESGALRFGTARHSVELMRLLDDPPRERCQVIVLAQSAMNRRQSDKWVRLAFIAETLRRHGRRQRLAKVRKVAYRFLGELIEGLGEQSRHRDGELLWRRLLSISTDRWMDTYNKGVSNTDRWLDDDPVPKGLARVLGDIDLVPLAEALEELPLRIVGGRDWEKERLRGVRDRVREVEGEVWVEALARMRWRSPLLVLDEAHHLKNPKTTLALTFQELEAGGARLGHGAIAGKFDRMLFLTATPFQLGHRELASVLQRFGNVRWDSNSLGGKPEFAQTLHDLEKVMDNAQRASIRFQRAWARLPVSPLSAGVAWSDLLATDRDDHDLSLQSVLNVYERVREYREAAETLLRPWIIRHNKGTHWDGGTIIRRRRLSGGEMVSPGRRGGVEVPPEQLLPFYLAARSTSDSRQDLLGEALASSYEAFRLTRRRRTSGKEIEGESEDVASAPDSGPPRWYLKLFDRALQEREGSDHPKMAVTVRRAVDLWEQGEKVLVFAFYVETCKALRFHISREIERRLYSGAARRLGKEHTPEVESELDGLLTRIQDRYFDTARAPGRRAIDRAIASILAERQDALDTAGATEGELLALQDVMRRFLRVATTLLRYFPIADLESVEPDAAVATLLDAVDQSGLTWRRKLDGFIRFLAEDCSAQEREDYLKATARLQTGGIRQGMTEEEQARNSDRGQVLLPNVQLAIGATDREARARLMRGFNTPFFPDILVSSEVMGEGVDLHRACRHVIHHDLDWNPSRLEQRTGRVDRLGCKAEGRHPIHVYMPYIAGMTDERQYKVMSDRERWFRVVMGQDQVAELVPEDGPELVPLPNEVVDALSFKLGLGSPVSARGHIDVRG